MKIFEKDPLNPNLIHSRAVQNRPARAFCHHGVFKQIRGVDVCVHVADTEQEANDFVSQSAKDSQLDTNGQYYDGAPKYRVVYISTGAQYLIHTTYGHKSPTPYATKKHGKNDGCTH